MIAALFVATDGCYFGLPDVDPWDEKRDARKYRGPHRVIAHPPCERWGAFYAGSPINIGKGIRKKLGDDNGCFKAALAAVRKFGGVLEHPANSRAWAHFGIWPPAYGGGWTTVDRFGGSSCSVEQGFYSHRAPKPTWLYAVRCHRWSAEQRAYVMPELKWGKSNPPPMPRPNGGTRGSACEIMGKPERLRTPAPFRDLLLSIARGAS